MQLDIFEHSRDVMLRNDVLLALEQRDATRARAAWQALASECPNDTSLRPLEVLTETIESDERAPFVDHDALCQARQALQSDIEPAARLSFGESGGGAWLRPQWALLARRAALLAFRSERSEDHAAPLWLLGGHWQAAMDAVAGIPSWRRIPAPLAWTVQARLQLFGLQATWPMLAELAWLSPRRLDPLVQGAIDPLLTPLASRFKASFEGEGDASDWAWFPAWVLTQRPDLAEHLAMAQASQHSRPEQAMRLVLELLGL